MPTRLTSQQPWRITETMPERRSHFPGLKPSLDAGDLVGAVIAQEQLNAWLAAPVDALPEGSVVVSISAVDPKTALVVNVPFNVTYEIESRLTSTRAKELYDISVGTAVPSTWDIVLDRNQLNLDSFGGRDTVVVTVTPRGGTLTTRLRLTATVSRNTTVTFTHQSEPFRIGFVPPTEEFFQWLSPALDANGRIPIPQADFADNEVMYQLNLINRSTTDDESYEILTFVIPPAGPDWHPIETEAVPVEVTVPAGQQQTSNQSLFGPTNPPVGTTTGTMVAQATLVRVNGNPVTNGKSTRLELEFIVVA